MTAKINNIDISALIAKDGLQFDEEPVYGENDGEGLGGNIIADLKGYRKKWSVKLLPMPAVYSNTLRSNLKQRTFMFYTDIPSGTVTAYEARCKNIPIPFHYERNGALSCYGMSFDLEAIEVD